MSKSGDLFLVASTIKKAYVCHVMPLAENIAKNVAGFGNASAEMFWDLCFAMPRSKQGPFCPLVPKTRQANVHNSIENGANVNDDEGWSPLPLRFQELKQGLGIGSTFLPKLSEIGRHIFVLCSCGGRRYLVSSFLAFSWRASRRPGAFRGARPAWSPLCALLPRLIWGLVATAPFWSLCCLLPLAG